MILVDLHQQVIVCIFCRDPVEIPRALLRDQHALLELQESTKKDHRECARYQHDPERAARERGFRKRVERELKKADGRSTQTRARCQGRRPAA